MKSTVKRGQLDVTVVTQANYQEVERSHNIVLTPVMNEYQRL